METESEPLPKPWRVWNAESVVEEFDTFAEADEFRRLSAGITGDITKGPKRYKRGEMPG